MGMIVCRDTQVPVPDDRLELSPDLASIMRKHKAALAPPPPPPDVIVDDTFQAVPEYFPWLVAPPSPDGPLLKPEPSGFGPLGYQ